MYIYLNVCKEMNDVKFLLLYYSNLTVQINELRFI